MVSEPRLFAYHERLKFEGIFHLSAVSIHPSLRTFASKSLTLSTILGLSLSGVCLAEEQKLFQSKLNYTTQGITDLSAVNRCYLPNSKPAQDSNPAQDFNLAQDSNQSLSQASNLIEPLVAANQIQLDSWQINFDSAPQISRDKMHLKGQVSARDAQSLIRADEIIIDKQKQTFSAQHNVSIETQDAYLTAQQLIKDETDRSQLSDAEFFFFSNNARGQAESIEVSSQPEGQQAQLNQLTFTTCPQGDDSWQFATSEMSIDSEQGRGEAWNTTLRINDIPVFYFPYINFPTDDRRKSGLLSPAINRSDKNGTEFSLPFYWNIAADKDATFTLRSIEKRGVQIGSELRLLTSSSFSQWQFDWLDNDKLIETALLDPTIITAADSSERWQSKFDYQSKLNQHWRLNVDAHRVSDADYFRDFSTGLATSNATHVTSKANLNYNDQVWDINLFSLSQQSLINVESYRYAPSLQVSAEQTFDSGWQLALESQWDRLEHKEQSFVDASRLNLLPSISYPMQASWGFATPKLSYHASHIKQQQLLADTNNPAQMIEDKQKFNRNIPVVSFDSGLHFERKLPLFNKPYTHLLSPRFFYSYTPYRDQQDLSVFDTSAAQFNFSQLWQSNRFQGYDRVGDSNQVSLALNNSLIESGTGLTKLNLNLGRQFYLESRRVQLGEDQVDQRNASPWLFELGVEPNQAFNIKTFLAWDESSNKSHQAFTQFKFEPKANHIVNVTHRYRYWTTSANLAQDPSLQMNQADLNLREEIDFSFAWPINDRWRLLGRWYNDIRLNRSIESMFGIEYESCCWAIRLVAQKYLNNPYMGANNATTMNMLADDDLNYSQGLSIQFVFKGLGSAGQTGLSNSLESGIQGYHDPYKTM
jgi:LPS-assembly protein